jgi:hypothetical protein
VSRLRRVEFGLIDGWVLTEKVDGTNIRLIFELLDETRGLVFDVRGKTDSAQIPSQLLGSLTLWCHTTTPEIQALMREHGLRTYALYGEGYGPKIQNGGRYRSDQGFILFDVQANGAWLDVSQVVGTGERLGLRTVPVLDADASLEDAVEMVKLGFASDVPDVFDGNFPGEGVVARTSVPLYDRRGERVTWKLKARDFRPGKR